MAPTTAESALPDLLGLCDEHFHVGEWQLGIDRANEQLEQDSESAEALERIAMGERWLDNIDPAFAARERAFGIYCRRGDELSAGRVAAELAHDNLMARSELAVANGWFVRSHELLDDTGDSLERGWLCYREASATQLADRGPVNRLALLAEASAIARDHGDAVLEMLTTSLTGYVEVCIGDVESGMAKVDRAATAIVAGEVEAFEPAGKICCDVISACEQVRDVDRAQQWLRAANSIRERGQWAPLLSICHVHYATLLMWEGDWSGAERELERAWPAIESGGLGLTGEHRVRLGALRLLQGRLDESSEIYESISWMPAAKLGHAQVAYARGERELARSLLERCRRSADDLERIDCASACLLSVRIELERGDIEAAREPAAKLAELAGTVQTDPLQAASQMAQGMIAAAEGDREQAKLRIEDAIDLWQAARAPYEAAQARLELADLLDELGDAALAASERTRGREVLERIGALAAAGASPESPLTRREIEVLRLVAEGLGDDEIAERLVLSSHTVHRHVANIRNKLDEPSRAAAVAHAARVGLL